MLSSFQMIDAGLLRKRISKIQFVDFSGDDRNNAGRVFFLFDIKEHILNSKKLNIIYSL